MEVFLSSAISMTVVLVQCHASAGQCELSPCICVTHCTAVYFVPCSVYKLVSPKLPLLECWGFPVRSIVCVALEHGQAVQLVMNTIKHMAVWSYVRTYMPTLPTLCLVT